MALKLADNLEYQGRKPDFVRQEYATFADMKAVKKSKMPEMYLAYCLEDRSYYQYDKNNTEDSVLGLWRKFSGSGGVQVTEMPLPDKVFAGSLLQFIGDTTADYTFGWFYTCVASGVEEVPVVTLTRLQELINSSTEVITLVLEDSSEVTTPVFYSKGTAFIEYESSCFKGTPVADKLVLADCIALPDDASVVASAVVEEVLIGWHWENQAVSPSGGEPAIIPSSDIEALFE